MSKMSERDLRKREAKRNIGEELLRAVQEMKAGKGRARASHSRVRNYRSAHALRSLATTICEGVGRLGPVRSRNGSRGAGSHPARRGRF
jgi:hypothetical protein